MIAMRFSNGVVSAGKTFYRAFSIISPNFQDYTKQNQLDTTKNGIKTDENNPRIDYSNPPLKKLNLRANHLKGNIILGNFTVSLISLWRADAKLNPMFFSTSRNWT